MLSTASKAERDAAGRTYAVSRPQASTSASLNKLGCSAGHAEDGATRIRVRDGIDKEMRKCLP